MTATTMSAVRMVGLLLVLVHLGLGVWGIVGLAELVAAEVPWRRLSNPLFPPHILLLQWLMVLTAALVFVPGYLARWPLLPWAMAVVYAAMASLCAVETVGFLQHDLRFVAMTAEYLTYIAILVFLFRTRPERIAPIRRA